MKFLKELAYKIPSLVATSYLKELINKIFIKKKSSTPTSITSCETITMTTTTTKTISKTYTVN